MNLFFTRLSPLVRAFFVLATIGSGTLSAHAQHYLNRPISTGAISRQPIVSILESISKAGDFHFSYNSERVPTDSLASVPPFEGTLAVFLERVQGDQ